MENKNTVFFSDSNLACLNTAANVALMIAFLTILKIGFTLYFMYDYYSYVSSDFNLDSGSWGYFGNSFTRIILSVLSALFLFMFFNKANQAKQSTQIEDWNTALAFFRNYLAIFAMMSVNWMFFSIIQYLF